MKNSLVYLTRRCPHYCEYCALRDGSDVGKELNVDEWQEQFLILEQLGIDFNLILGNETWLYGEKLLTLLSESKIPYALYTTCWEPQFSTFKDKLFQGGIDNLSCGIDYPLSYLQQIGELKEDSERKSLDAWKGFQWLKKHYPRLDSQGTVTIHRKNFKLLPTLVAELSELGVFCGVNFIHWDKDGGFDFFPNRQSIEHLLFKDRDLVELREVLDQVLHTPGKLQNPEMLKEDVKRMVTMGWHCNGDPYGGPTIDADGSLRVCGYRKGKRTSKFVLKDLLFPGGLLEWRNGVLQDALECPGCFWSYPWMYDYWRRNPKMGEKVFAQHAGEHIPKKEWSKRRTDK